ncbi:pepsin/retropepsin-like aspartic protease family protein [Achromobacter aloeverae]|uniref:Peptidase A2 domain-containing protein n=1 Tax=Achromobacter aloeverae TaxID=1750518 RepID=A0A4Q1HL30_9BURK|nr:hypothetical protein [Achromobacter aloeverae]RXN91141.1 hypothetical protein C7R54_08100 [Achromobacter aloeverae]
MGTFKATVCLLAFAALALPLHVSATTKTCSAGLTNNPVQFEGALHYDDMQSKRNPTVHVRINGKPAKMMLDSGSNSNSLWDGSLLNEAPSARVEKLDGIAGSAEARTVNATLADDHGHALRQEFYLLTDSALLQDGYAGILSPQAVAGLDAVVIDFEKNCFFTSAPFDIAFDHGLRAGQSTTIRNPHNVIAISVQLDNRIVPVIIDSGAPRTFIQASLVSSNPKGELSPRMMDIFKAEIPGAEHMRLVDLKINGREFKSLPVIPRQTEDARVVANFGYIGMDILKERIVYYDARQQEFRLLTHQELAQHAEEPEARAE